MKKFIKLAVIIAKIAELTHWAAAAVFFLLAGAEVFAGSEFIKSTVFGNIFSHNFTYDETAQQYFFNGVNIYGLQIRCQTAFNSYNSTAMLLYSIGAVIILCLVAAAFGNIHKKLKNTNLFNETTVILLKKIGICFIAVSAVCLITSITASNYMSLFHADFNFTSTIAGIFIICLSEYFKYGQKLQEDNYGLI